MTKKPIILSTLAMALLINEANATAPLPAVNFTESTAAVIVRNNLTQCAMGTLCDLPVSNISELIRPENLRVITHKLNDLDFSNADELDIQFSFKGEIELIQDCKFSVEQIASQFPGDMHVDRSFCAAGSLGGINVFESGTGVIKKWQLPNFKSIIFEYSGLYCSNDWGGSIQQSCNIVTTLGRSDSRDFIFQRPKFAIDLNGNISSDTIEYTLFIVDSGMVPTKQTLTPTYGWQRKVVTVKVPKKHLPGSLTLSCSGNSSEINSKIINVSTTVPILKGNIALNREIQGTQYVQSAQLKQFKKNCPSGVSLKIRDIVPADPNAELPSLAIRYSTFTDETQYWQDYGSLIIKDLSASFSIWDRLDFINRDVTTSHAQVLKYMRDYSVLVKAELDLYYAAKGLDPALGLSFFYDATWGELSGILISIVDLAAAPADWAAFHQSLNTGGINENVNYVFNIEMLGNLEQVRLNGAVTTLPTLVKKARIKLDNEIGRSLFFMSLMEHATQATQDNLCELRNNLNGDLAKIPNPPATSATAICKSPAVLAQQNQQNNIKVKSTISFSRVTTSVIK